MKKLLICILLVTTGIHLFASSDSTDVVISGTVVNNLNNTPIPNHEVFLNTLIQDSVVMQLTDSSGYFHFSIDSIQMQDTAVVFTFGNCFNQQEYYEQIVGLHQSTHLYFNICHVIDTMQCDARFQYSFEDANTVKFTNYSVPQDLTTLLWDFGDGNYSTDPNPVHTFGDNPLYAVCLSILSDNCSDMECKTIHFSQTTFVYGYARFNNTSFPNCLVRLYNLNQPSLVYETTTNEIGLYTFQNIPTDDYIIEALPRLPYAHYTPMLYPTYSGNKLFWQEAQASIQETENTIQYVSNNQIVYGNCSVSGEIQDNNNLLPVQPAVLLLTTSNEPVAYAETNQAGDFVIDEVPEGNYLVFPQAPGFITTPFEVSLSQSNPNSIATFAVETEAIYPVVNSIKTLQTVLSIYPNPLHNHLTIENDQEITQVELFGTDGRCCSRFLFYKQKSVIISTGNLNQGFYICRITTPNEVISKIVHKR